MSVLLTVIASMALVAGPESPFETARAELVGETAERVEELAESCHRWRLYAERDRVYELLLSLEPLRA